MSGWIKGVIVTLSVLVTAGVASVITSSSASATEAPASVTIRSERVTTFAEQVATKAFKKVKAKFDRDKRKAARKAKRTGRKPNVKPMTHVSRWASLPVSLRTPIQGLYASRPTRLDDDGVIAMFTGSNDTAACLSMRTGTVRRGICGTGYRPIPGSLALTYDVMIRSAQWFDAHSAIYGKTARSAALIAALVRTSPVGTEAQIIDADRDGIVDDGTIVLTAGTSCGTVILPETNPAGGAYSAELLHGVC